MPLCRNGYFHLLKQDVYKRQVIHIIPDNYGSLKLRKKMRELNCTKRVIIGGWSSAPYGTRVEKEGGVQTSDMWLVYRALTLRGASLPSDDQEIFLNSSKYLGCFDSITQGDGAVGGNTAVSYTHLRLVEKKESDAEPMIAQSQKTTVKKRKKLKS